MDLVEAGRELLGQATGVGEDDGGPVLLDEVDDRTLHKWPERSGRRSGGLVVDLFAAGDHRDVGHVRDGDVDREVERLGRRRLHDRVGPAAGEESCDTFGWPDGCRQPDALCRVLEQGVETFERQRQVCSPLGAGHGVHLVDDDRLHRGERVARGRREHQEEGFGGGDQDVGWGAEQLTALCGRGVA